MRRGLWKVAMLAVPGLFLWSGVTSAQEILNYALGKPVTTSLGEANASKITDGQIPNRQWRCPKAGLEQWVEIDLTAEFEIHAAHIYFDMENMMPLANWTLQYSDRGTWRDIPGTQVVRNYNSRVEQRFATPVSTDRIRLLTKNSEAFGIAEIQLWGSDVPQMPYGVSLQEEPPYEARQHWVCVNQVAYNRDAPKFFTVPTAKSDLRFQLVEQASGKRRFSGRLHRGKGDFSAFRPEDDSVEYCIVVRGDGLEEGRSYPFRIAPRAIQQASYEPAVLFMNDVRSLVGTHPSCYGGTPWRDGTYYTYELPSMVLLYLSDKRYFDGMEVTQSWARDRARLLSPDFRKTKDPNDRDALTTLEGYYTLLPKPVREDVPDLIQDIRFAAGWYLLDPITYDPSGDPVGERMHAQTIEQFAYFLYAYPAMSEYVSREFYDLILQATLRWWSRAGLFQVIERVGSGKGRECPGHSIMPNLLMYEVAKREGVSDPERFFRAAYDQTVWILEHADWNNPQFTKGQRMSEHKLVTGLAHFQLNYADRAPKGLSAKLEALAERYAALSDNMWDFRRFDLQENWTIPGFNECGNVAGFPACALSLAMCLEPGPLKERMVELAYSHFDNLYGRNPLNAHAASHPETFIGVERGFPYKKLFKFIYN